MLLEKRASGSDRKSCEETVSISLIGCQIRSRKGITYDVVASDLVGLTPGAHDVGVVVGKDGNNVDTLLTELGESLDVAGDVSGRADRSEGT